MVRNYQGPANLCAAAAGVHRTESIIKPIGILVFLPLLIIIPFIQLHDESYVRTKHANIFVRANFYNNSHVITAQRVQKRMPISTVTNKDPKITTPFVQLEILLDLQHLTCLVGGCDLSGATYAN